MQVKNRILAALLAFFLGSFGVHRFYLGRNLTGILYFMFCWTFIPSFFAIIDMIRYLLMSEDEFDLRYNTRLLIDSVHHRNSSQFQREPAPRVSVKSKAEELKELNELRLSGAIDEDEYEKLKAEVMKS